MALWGGAERGFLITDAEIRLCDLEGQWRIPFKEIQAIRAVGQSVVLQEHARTAEFDLQEPPGLGCILATLNAYLECVRHEAASAREPDLGAAEQERVAEICRQHMGPAGFSGAASCMVTPDIPAETMRMVRFLLGLHAPEKLLAVSILSPDACTEAFAVTSRGMHTLTEEGWGFLSWTSLRQLGAPAEFVKSVRCGIAFGDGSSLVCSRLRADRQTFGAALTQACVSALDA